jgi:hypothetical protein
MRPTMKLAIVLTLACIAHAADEKVYKAAVVLMADDRVLEWSQQPVVFTHDTVRGEFRAERISVLSREDVTVNRYRIVFGESHLDGRMVPPQRVLPGKPITFDASVKYGPQEQAAVMALFAQTQPPSAVTTPLPPTVQQLATPATAPASLAFTEPSPFATRPPAGKRGAAEIIEDVLSSERAARWPTDPDARKYVEMIWERFDALRKQQMDFPTALRRARAEVVSRVFEDAVKGAIQ